MSNELRPSFEAVEKAIIQLVEYAGADCLHETDEEVLTLFEAVEIQDPAQEGYLGVQGFIIARASGQGPRFLVEVTAL